MQFESSIVIEKVKSVISQKALFTAVIDFEVRICRQVNDLRSMLENKLRGNFHISKTMKRILLEKCTLDIYKYIIYAHFLCRRTRENDRIQKYFWIYFQDFSGNVHHHVITKKTKHAPKASKIEARVWFGTHYLLKLVLHKKWMIRSRSLFGDARSLYSWITASRKSIGI